MHMPALRALLVRLTGPGDDGEQYGGDADAGAARNGFLDHFAASKATGRAEKKRLPPLRRVCELGGGELY